MIIIPNPSKDASRMDNLKCISLLSATSKVFKRLLRDHLERLDVLIPELQVLQIPPFSSTGDCRKFVARANRQRDFLDVKKVFDLVWNEDLLYKLHEVLLRFLVFRVIVDNAPYFGKEYYLPAS